MARASSNSDTPKGIHDSAPKRSTVGTYEERPYGEAISPDHKAFLAEHGVEVKKSTATEASALDQLTPDA